MRALRASLDLAIRPADGGRRRPRASWRRSVPGVATRWRRRWAARRAARLSSWVGIRDLSAAELEVVAKLRASRLTPRAAADRVHATRAWRFGATGAGGPAWRFGATGAGGPARRGITEVSRPSAVAWDQAQQPRGDQRDVEHFSRLPEDA